MTIDDFCKKHGFPTSDIKKIERYLHKQREYKIKTNFTGNFVIDASNEEIVLDLIDEYYEEVERLDDM